ncbi:MAG: glycosyltransferase family 4 protein [Candidatus Omnitrophica bacterium]|nr:glycosyltransferase family 4 protein [Candidatus Omnitrophota bacterium]
MEEENKIRLAFIEETSSLGGAQLNNIDLQKSIDRSHFEVIVICPTEGPLTEALKRLGVSVEIVRMPSLMSTSSRIGRIQIFNPFAVFIDIFIVFLMAFKLGGVFRRFKIHAVMTNGMFAHLYGGLASKISDVGCLWHFDDIVKPNLFFGWVIRFLRQMAKIIPYKIIVPSKAVKDAMFPGDEFIEKVKVIYNTADLEIFNVNRVAPRLRDEFSISAENIVVGIFSRLAAWKGHREFLQAAASLRKRNPNVKFMVVGGAIFEDRGYEQELRKLVSRLGIQNDVIFTGFRKDVPECIASMDLCVLPSILPDPSPRVLFEAMAMEKALIATKLGGAPEIIEDNKTGLLVPAGDIHKLSEAITFFVDHPEIRKQMGEAGRLRLQHLFNRERFVYEHVCLFEEAGGFTHRQLK